MTPAPIVLKRQSIDDVIRDLIENRKQKEPFHIMNLDEICERVEYWRAMVPRVKIFYAVKANDHEWLLKVLAALGTGFDCASPGEINKILRLHVPPRSIVYAQPVKSAEQMQYARAVGVTHTTFDSEHELRKLKQHWPDARLLLRIKVSSNAKYNLSEKYGCEPLEEATTLLDLAADMGLKVIGVAFHVGSGLMGTGAFEGALKNAHALFQHEVKKGRKMRILDIGGGFIGDKINRIDEATREIKTWIEELFPDPEIQIVAEPGRYICESSLTLYCTINKIKKISLSQKDVMAYYLSEGVYGTLRFTEPWHAVEKYKKSKDKSDSPMEEVILFGPSCDSIDVVMNDRRIHLPSCSPDDWLIFHSQGAYSITVVSPFSSLKPPLILIVISDINWQKLNKLPGIKTSDVVDEIDFTGHLPSTLPELFKTEDIFSHNSHLLL